MLDACESCKPVVDMITERDELTTYKLIEDAAVKLFYAADKADRAGVCNQRTAQSFMKASTLFEALTEVMRESENDPKVRVLPLPHRSVPHARARTTGHASLDDDPECTSLPQP